MGLYKLYTIAGPIPNSTIPNIDIIFKNNPFNPLYSVPNFLINNDWVINVNNIFIILENIDTITFLVEFATLLSVILISSLHNLLI